MVGEEETPSDRLRKRLDQNRVKLWILMEGDRWLLTGILLVVVFLAIAVAGYLYPGTEAAIRASDSVDTLFQALLTATITGVTIVVTLNQLVLSQELGAVKDQRERMEGAMEFRQDVADVIQAQVSPSRPAQFLRALVQVSGERAMEFRNAVSESSDENLIEEIKTFTDSLIENANQVAEGLDDACFGEFDVISSALNFNYSWKIFTARRIHEEYSEAFTKEGEEALEKLIEVLRLFGPTREHFKTLFFQRDLIDLSRRILISALPALLVSTYMIIFFNFNTYNLVISYFGAFIVIIAAAATVSLLPFLILLSYVLRIATITKHTLSIGPFILRETEEVEEVEWNR
ncbi:MAG: putative membrane protein [Candidatus Methanohalarchaeum thermophilum]|uniref:Membrane protein n=1 Tax=Methanohalarchaeum thermophilum TaxID=1903181 RepID=A0A1Q6DSW9_METT1|nr:MAG: putative membrane protein [Candidatus Methanohalarchaeum thermophilum]